MSKAPWSGKVAEAMSLDKSSSCPEALVAFQEMSRWVNWGIEALNPKRPYTPGNGSLSPASTADPSTWLTYHDAEATAAQHDCGVGLVLSPADDDFDIVAFDLDKCRNPENGDLAPWAKELIEKAASYTEITPSGTGLRIIGTGSDVELHCDLPRDGDGHLEVYSQTNRFITVTGNHLDCAPKQLANLSELITQHQNEYLAQQLVSVAQENSFDGRKIERLIDELGQPGKWHNSMVRLAGHLVAKGESDSAIQAFARPWTQPGFTPEQTRTEVQAAIYGARKKGFDRSVGRKEVQQADGLKFLSLDELANEPPPQMLIKDIFPERGVAIIYGKSGSMKSFLMISMAMHVALGLDLGDQVVKQKPVLMLLNEGQAGFSLRCEAWLMKNGKQRPENFRTAKMTPNLTHANPNDQFIAMAEEMEFRPGLIVIDSFSKATFGGDDNSTSEMALAMGAADQLAAHFGALVVLVDHVGKDQNKGVRGAYAKHANADMVGWVTKFDNRVMLKTTKQKEAEDDRKFVFKAALVDMPIPDDAHHKVPALIHDSDPIEAIAAAYSQPKFILGVLDAEGRMTREQLKKRFLKHYGDGKAKSFGEVIRRLKNDRKIMEDADGFTLLD
jgi:hypothetical protein